MSFQARVRLLQGSIALPAPVARVFPLFSPEGERAWVPGWDPEPIRPADGAWTRGAVFRTRETYGDAIWVVTRLERESFEVEYHRVEPDRWVARVEVRCASASPGDTRASVAYEFIGLSPRGNEEIAAMTDADYASKLERWEGWIRKHLGA